MAGFDIATRGFETMKPRKLILSRKGFDTTRRSQHPSGLVFPYGGVPSPIFRDSSLYSLPIPGFDEVATVTYGDLYHGDESSPVGIGQVVEDLTQGRATSWTADHYAFVSPNIRPPYLWEVEGRRGMVHQGTPAQSGHLRNQGVEVGDLFLFFGIFRRVELVRGRWRFAPGTRPQHVLFGWLQVGLVYRDAPPDDGPWFVACDRLDLGTGVEAPGFGVFPMAHERLVLTRPGGNTSEWRLPRWFYPDPPKHPLSHHPHSRWTRDNRYAYVQRKAHQGQEFVLDLREYPEALGWCSGLVHEFGKKY